MRNASSQAVRWVAPASRAQRLNPQVAEGTGLRGLLEVSHCNRRGGCPPRSLIQEGTHTTARSWASLPASATASPGERASSAGDLQTQVQGLL